MSLRTKRRGPKPQVFVERFWKHVDRTDMCWIWTGARTPHGYGLFAAARPLKVYAHRVSYELTYGPIPKGMVVCHHCDTPNCVRPTHLFLGTQADNLHDMAAKGRKRVAFGNVMHAAKLTWETVRSIRTSYAQENVKMTELARTYTVTRSTIWNIITHRTWKE